MWLNSVSVLLISSRIVAAFLQLLTYALDILQGEQILCMEIIEVSLEYWLKSLKPTLKRAGRSVYPVLSDSTDFVASFL